MFSLSLYVCPTVGCRLFQFGILLRVDNLAIARSLFQVNQPWLTMLRASMKSLLSTRESPLLWQS